MRNYTIRRLDALDVHAVIRRGTTEYPTYLRAVTCPPIESDNRSWFAFDGKFIYLPRKKRGDKYIIRYTELKQVVV